MTKRLYSDLDGTLIRTKSGKTFPQNAEDWEFNPLVIEAIRNYRPNELVIITNQGGVSAGYMTKEEWEDKISEIISTLLSTFNVPTYCQVCFSNDSADQRRKPNPGMIEEFRRNRPVADELMIGDASGLPGQFSDSDKKCAENANVEYMDVSQFVDIYNGTCGGL